MELNAPQAYFGPMTMHSALSLIVRPACAHSMPGCGCEVRGFRSLRHTQGLCPVYFGVQAAHALQSLVEGLATQVAPNLKANGQLRTESKRIIT